MPPPRRPRPCIGNRGPCPTRALTKHDSGRCDTCRTARDKSRGTTTQRGYGSPHQQLRKQYEPLVTSGQATCWRCGQPIAIGALWDLGHVDGTSRHAGPEHVGNECQMGGNRATNRKDRR